MFEAIFFGHFIGDYLFQTDWMATNKQQKTWTGLWACLIHCIVYALTMTVTMSCIGILSWQIFVIAFLSHYPIDRYGLANKWMKMIGSTPPVDVFKIENYQTREIRKMFSPIVYVVSDNTMHLLLMFAAFKWLFG
jgi:hypothetical protein